MTEAALRDALAACFDPLTKQDIVSARMVRSAQLTPDTDAPGAGIPGVSPRYIARLTLQAPHAEDATAQLAAQIGNRLAGLAAISRTEITWLPPLFPILSKN